MGARAGGGETYGRGHRLCRGPQVGVSGQSDDAGEPDVGRSSPLYARGRLTQGLRC